VTLHKRKKIASMLKKIVKAEQADAWLHRRLQYGLRRLAEKAQQMGLTPEDILTDNGRDAFIVIARAILGTPQPVYRNPLGAEWRTVVELAEPPLFEREALRTA
jgi:hypothetical protein